MSVYPPHVLSQARDAFAGIAAVDDRYSSVRRHALAGDKDPRELLERLERLAQRYARERRRLERELEGAHRQLTEAILADLTSGDDDGTAGP